VKVEDDSRVAEVVGDASLFSISVSFPTVPN
jgi:hypothetical protein